MEALAHGADEAHERDARERHQIGEHAFGDGARMAAQARRAIEEDDAALDAFVARDLGEPDVEPDAAPRMAPGTIMRSAPRARHERSEFERGDDGLG